MPSKRLDNNPYNKTRNNKTNNNKQINKTTINKQINKTTRNKQTNKQNKLTIKTTRKNKKQEANMKYNTSGNFFCSISCWFSPKTYDNPVTTPITINPITKPQKRSHTGTNTIYNDKDNHAHQLILTDHTQLMTPSNFKLRKRN